MKKKYTALRVFETDKIATDPDGRLWIFTSIRAAERIRVNSLFPEVLYLSTVEVED